MSDGNHSDIDMHTAPASPVVHAGTVASQSSSSSAEETYGFLNTDHVVEKSSSAPARLESTPKPKPDSLESLTPKPESLESVSNRTFGSSDLFGSQEHNLDMVKGQVSDLHNAVQVLEANLETVNNNFDTVKGMMNRLNKDISKLQDKN